MVCAGVALAQTGVGLATRHGTPPRLLTFTPGRSRALLLGGLAVCLAVALLAGAPGRISHAWQDFKHPRAAALHQDSIARFGTVSGNGRYDYWKVAIDATGRHLLGGSGAGTFQLVWTPRAPYYSSVENAHSLYVETLADTGLVGLVLLGAFFVLMLGAAVRLSIRSRYEARVRAAGVTAALIAFSVAAASDWIWQVPALPAAALLLAAAVFAPGPRPSTQNRSARAALPWRIGAITVAIAALVAIAIPLATVSSVQSKPVGRDDRQIGPSAGRCAHGGTPAARSCVVTDPACSGARAPRRHDGRADRGTGGDSGRAGQLERVACPLATRGRSRSPGPRAGRLQAQPLAQPPITDLQLMTDQPNGSH